MADGGLFGKISESSVFRFALLIVLVWIAVDLGKVLSGLVPQAPAAVRSLMNPQGNRPAVDAVIGQ